MALANGPPKTTRTRSIAGRSGLGLALATLAVVVIVVAMVGWLTLAGDRQAGESARSAAAISLILPPPTPVSEAVAEVQPESQQGGLVRDDDTTTGSVSQEAIQPDLAQSLDTAAAENEATEGAVPLPEVKAPSADTDIASAGQTEAQAVDDDPPAEPVAPQSDEPVADQVTRTDSTRPTAVAPTATQPSSDRPAPPDPTLTEPGPAGPLPRISDDGRTPWRAYARPFDPTDRRPRIAVIVSWLGLSRAASETAIQNLPAGVTLAFSPYADDLDTWLARARAAGHETLLNLPMEPIGYPAKDPGPNTLLTGLTQEENLARLEWLLSRVNGYVGVINHMGSRFTTTPDALRPVLDAVHSRGLLFVDSRTSADSAVGQVSQVIGLPYVVNDRNVDHRATRDAIDAQLTEIEQIAARTGQAVAVGLHFPVTLERLALWLPTLEANGFVLAPVSTMIENPDSVRAAAAP